MLRSSRSRSGLGAFGASALALGFVAETRHHVLHLGFVTKP